MTFQRKVTLITGGSSGIGLATAQAFAREGAHVWLAARNEDRLCQARRLVMDSCDCSDQRCGYIACDVADFEQASRLVATLEAEIGLPDIVVNCAGVVRPGYFQEIQPDAFRDMMNVNYFGALNIIRAVTPEMMKRGSGHIVNVLSGAVLVPGFGYSAYAPSKHALRGLSDVLRLELKRHGVRISVVYPPDTDTPQLAAEAPYKPIEAKRVYEGTVIVSPDLVARAILDGVRRDRYSIIVGGEMKAAAMLARWLGDWQFGVLDWLIARAQQSKRGT